MTDTKTLGKQIETHRKELEAMRADEAELSRLHAEKSAELEAMRGGKSRDFAGMAALEGQRAALETMLREQRGEIGQTEARVADLERQAARVDHLAELGRRADQVQSLAAEVDGTMTELESTLGELLTRLSDQRRTWHRERMAALEYAQRHLSLPYPSAANGSAWPALFRELTAAGYAGAALASSPCVYPRGDQFSFTAYWQEQIPPDLLDYMKHRMGTEMTRPVMAAIARAVRTAEGRLPTELKGAL